MAKTNKRRASLQEYPGKGSAAAPCGCHPLLATVAEGKHELSGEGEDRVEQEPERAPGIDCCAVCAGDCASEILCVGCATVVYCSEQHREEDAPNHGQVCEVLRLMRAAEALPPLNGAADSKAEPQQESVLDQPPVYQGTADGFRVPGAAAGAAAAGGEAAEGAAAAALAEGWAVVMPAKFRAVFGGAAGEAAEEGAVAAAAAADGAEDKAEHPRKKARKAAADGTAGAHKPAAGKADSADAQLLLAAQLADRTAELTYVYTAAQALLAGPAAKVAAAAARAGRALQLVVLGAAEDAELADLAAWQVVAAALDTDVRIVFVGPQVPERLAGMGAQYGRVAMRFVQATYDEMAGGKVAGVDPSSLDGSAVVFLAFNPGFTCPDYDWGATLDAIGARSAGGRGGAGAVLVVATNTRVEALMDCELLLERGWRPAGGAEHNPYTSLQARQSGTLANDLYRKNAWLVAYQHVGQQEDGEEDGEEGGGRGGRRRRRRAARSGGPRGAAGRVARALLDTLKKPFKGLMRRR
ncbi:hypothetical protein HXX76_002737 [Chlamydomonas incerta]|uniref:MYND-type domain-containing protein n=1 Tax=Chlamydomonas incerta TaxID=51695 RepID=A0A835TFU1_CHLIN|nr:hypothetical protein HXX76_002737 [Chlamydomonas incerta]|eukprot:KAG2442653.1 hypothetical protein HXX76_002737 [Chlamydomonas incerta]